MVSKINIGRKVNRFKNIVTFLLLSLAVLGIMTGTASATDPGVSTANVTGANTFTIVFNTSVNALYTDFTDLNGSIGGRNVTSITGNTTNTIVATFDGDAVGTNATATVDLGVGITSAGTSTPLVAINDQVLADGQAPTLDITPVTSPTTVNYQNITGNVSEGTVTVNGTNAPVNGGVYSYNLTDLVEGSNTITVIATDSLGNQATETATITVDTIAPTLDITPVTSPTNHNYQIITGNVSEGTVTVNGTNAPVNGGVYSYNLTGLSGTTAITVIATDLAGNMATNSTSITVDTIVPTLEISAPSASLTKGGPITYNVNYTGADAVTLENSNITLDATGNATGTVAVTGSGTTTMTVNISGITGDGTLGISIAASTASDTAGNLASAAGPSTNFTVDNTAPTLSITPVTSPTNVNYQIITGNISDGTVTVNGFAASLSGTVYSYNLTGLVEGPNVVTVNATDSVGNMATESTSITVDTTAPTIPVVTDDGASTTSITSLHANWTSSDPGSGIAEYFYAIGTSAGATNVVNWTSTGTTPNVTASSLSLNVSTTYYFTVKAKDVLGSNSTAGNSDGITVLHSSAPGTYDIGLVPGWNLISLPLIPTNDSIENVTAGIQSKIGTDGIWHYNSSLSRWDMYSSPGDGSLTKMQAGKGYWISMDSSTTLTITGTFLPAKELPPQYSVNTGWNLIGIHAQENKLASEYLANLGGYGTGWSSLFKYTGGQYASISSTGTMDLGNGFWLYAPRNGTLIPN